MQTRRFGGFCYFRVLVSRPRANGAVRAADSARSVSVHQDCAGSNRARHRRRQQPLPCAPRARPVFSLSDLIRRETKRRRARFLTLVFGASKIQWEERPMAIVRNIEVIAQSPNGFDDACREAIREASKTLRGISSFWIKNAEVVVENDQITMFRVNGKISFLVEDRLASAASKGAITGALASVPRRICRPAFRGGFAISGSPGSARHTT